MEQGKQEAERCLILIACHVNAEEGGGVMARRDDLVEALDAIETGMCRVKESRDIWQNDLVYALCQGVRLLLMKELRKEKRG